MKPRTLAIGVILAVVGAPASGQDAPDPQLSAVAAAWKNRRDTNRPLEYQLTGKSVIHPPAENDPLGPPGKKAVVSPNDRTLLIDWATGRYRRETKRQTADGFEADSQVFNGKVIQGRRRELLPNGDERPGSEKRFGIGQGSLSHAIFPAEEWPVFFAAGVVPSKVSDDLYPGHMRFPPELDLWRLHGSERIDGRNCIVFRTYPTGQGKRFYEVAVDPQRDGALVRMTGLIDASTRFLNLSIHWKQSEFGWQPSAWRHERFRDGALASYDEFAVTSIRSPQVSAKDFELTPGEGEIVVRNTYSEGGDGKIEKEELLQEDRGRLVPIEIVGGEVRQKRSWWPYVMSGLVLVLGCGLVVWFRSRRRPRAAG
jgi:hypothetical protein